MGLFPKRNVKMRITKMIGFALLYMALITWHLGRFYTEYDILCADGSGYPSVTPGTYGEHEPRAG